MILSAARQLYTRVSAAAVSALILVITASRAELRSESQSPHCQMMSLTVNIIHYNKIRNKINKESYKQANR